MGVENVEALSDGDDQPVAGGPVDAGPDVSQEAEPVEVTPEAPETTEGNQEEE